MELSTKLIVFYVLFVARVLAFLVPEGFQHVQTRYGEIIGNNEIIHFDGISRQVQKFVGIPYAEPPVGDLRFRKPVPILSMRTPFKAKTFGPGCPQYASSKYASKNEVFSEDCLYLNVFVPGKHDPTISNKPVLIWIHGGAFTQGSSTQYPAEVLSTYTDVIVVTINYRLGPLGFLSVHDSYASGNYGLWDQHLAIRWVKENIASFGGDNTNVTISGQSAGSISVIYQMLFPGNKGMFQRAIAESGTPAAYGSTSKGVNYQASITFAVSVGCNNLTHKDTMACLRKKPTDEIKSAVQKQFKTYYNEIYPKWVPVFDNDFVIGEPIQIIKELSMAEASTKYETFFNTDLLIGACNFDGMTNMVGAWLPMLNLTTDLNYILKHSDLVSRDDFEHVIIPRAAALFLHEEPSALVEAAVKLEYTDWKHPTDSLTRIKMILNMSTDLVLNVPITIVADARAVRNMSQSTYVYQFASSILELPASLGPDASYHGNDLAYLFGMSQNIVRLYGLNQTVVTTEQLDVSKAVMTMWTNFVKTGNPNDPVDVRPLFDLKWYNYGLSRNYLEITRNMTKKSVKTGFAARGVEFWNKLVRELQSFS